MVAERGAWIFLSHSTKDWDQVRKVRNLLEDQKHRPLMFFLKCLNEENEIGGLIKREIDARHWFLLCNSKNAKASRWVDAEMTYIKSLTGKRYEEIDLDQEIETQVERINRLCKRATVVISYAWENRDMALSLMKDLEEKDLGVFTMERLAPSVDWEKEFSRAVSEAAARGYVLVLLSKAAMRNPSFVRELDRIVRIAMNTPLKGNILPIGLDPIAETISAMPPHLSHFFWAIQWLDLSAGYGPRQFASLFEYVLNRNVDD